MHKVYLERVAERDLKRLSAEDFRRVISHIRGLWPKIQGPPAVERLVARKGIGESVLEIIGSSTKSMTKLWRFE